MPKRDGKKNNNILIKAARVTAVSLFLLIVFLILSYFSIFAPPWGFKIDKKEDLIQIGILYATLGTGIFVILYVYYTRKQVAEMKTQADAATKQLQATFAPVITLTPESYAIKSNDFEKETEQNRFLIIRYKIKNSSKNRGDYFLTVTPYIIPDEYLAEPLKFQNAVIASENSDSPIKINEQPSLQGTYKRTIQPFEKVDANFRIKLGEFGNYLKKYMNANTSRFVFAQGKCKDVKQEGIFFSYVKKKGGEETLQPDPFWLRFDLEVFNPSFEEEYTKYRVNLVYYTKMDHEGGKLNIKFVREENI